jgi:hypothetical protein
MANQNALFVIFAVSDVAAAEKRIQTIAPWLSLNVGPGAWLVIAPSGTTTKEISERIGLGSSDPIGTGIVVRAEGYFGRAPSSTWEWIATKTGADLGSIAPDTQVSDLSAELLATAQDLMNERTERKRLQDRLDARDRVANEVATRNIAAHEGLDKSDL